MLFSSLIDPCAEFLPCLPVGYKYIRKIGTGGQGNVWLVLNQNRQRREAVKILATRVRSANARFFREVKLLANLQHPHIVTLYYADPLNHYFIMEYLPAGSLADFLKKQYSLLEALRILHQVANGLHYAHQAGAIHRDLKPKNILFAPNYVAKITDFGLAKSIDDYTYTGSATILGTPQYMSPEQWKSSKHVDCRADIWALGIILYEILAKRRPFENLSGAELMYAILTKEITLPNIQFRNLGPCRAQLTSICLKALAKQPGQRYQDAAMFAQELAKVIENLQNYTRSQNSHSTVNTTVTKTAAEEQPSCYLGIYKLLQPAQEDSHLYMSLHPRLRRKVVIRLIPESEMELYPEDFINRGVKRVTLEHPHLVKIHDVGQQGANYYMVRDEVKGQPLVDYLEKLSASLQPRLRLRRVLKLGRQICQAIDYLHSHRLVHGRLHPEHILVNSHGNAVVIDAEFVNLNKSRGKRGSSSTARTHGFIPPEGRPLGFSDYRADIYALGALIYFMATGQPAISSSHDSMKIPAPLYAICQRAMAREPKHRYPNAALLSQDIQRFLERRRVLATTIYHRVLFRIVGIVVIAVLGLLSIIGWLNFNKKQALTKGAVPAAGRQPTISSAVSRKSSVQASIPTIRSSQSSASAQFLKTSTKIPTKAPAQHSDKAESLLKYREVVKRYLFAKKYQQIIRYCKLWSQKRSQDGEPLYYIAIAKYCQNEYDQAIAAYTQALQKKVPQEIKPKIYNQRGNCYYLQQKWPKALVDYNQAINIAPFFCLAYCNRAYVYRQYHNFSAALKDYQHCIDMEPAFLKAYFDRANLYIEQQYLDKAIKDYDIILQHQQCAQVYNNRGYVYYLKKHYKAALRDLSAGLNIMPRHSNARYLRGLVYRELKQYQHALADFKKVASIDPSKQLRAYLQSAAIYTACGQKQAARAEWKKVLNLDPTNPEALQYLGCLEKASRSTKPSLQIIKKGK